MLMVTMHTNRYNQILYWSLYDLANSLVVAVFGLYFSQWLVVDNHISDLSFNLIFIVSSFFLLLTAPLFGVYVDRIHAKMPSLRFSTLCSFIALASVSILAQFVTPTKAILVLVMIASMATQYFYQLSYVFYNPLLKELGTVDEQAKISGIGAAAGQFGQVIGLAITLPLATGALYLFGHHDESQVFIPAALLFLILVLPMLTLFKEKGVPKTKVEFNIVQEWRVLIQKFIDLKKYPGVHRFLLANFFFTDAVLTAAHNFPIYIHQVFHLHQKTSTAILGVIVIAGVVGAVLSGWISERLGEKKFLMILLGFWIVLFPIIALQTKLIPFIFCMIITGMVIGAGTAATRVVLNYLSPTEELTHIFSYYAMSSRLASFAGPLLWGLLTFAFYKYGLVRYQIALGGMTFLLIIAYWVVRKIPSENEVHEGVRV